MLNLNNPDIRTTTKEIIIPKIVGRMVSYKFKLELAKLSVGLIIIFFGFLIGWLSQIDSTIIGALILAGGFIVSSATIKDYKDILEIIKTFNP